MSVPLPRQDVEPRVDGFVVVLNIGLAAQLGVVVRLELPGPGLFRIGIRFCYGALEQPTLARDFEGGLEPAPLLGLVLQDRLEPRLFVNGRAY